MSLGTKNRSHLFAISLLAFLLAGVSHVAAQEKPAIPPPAAMPEPAKNPNAPVSLTTAKPAPAPPTPVPTSPPLQTAATPVPAVTGPVPVSIEQHGNYARITFQFPKLFAYRVKELENGDMELSFDSTAATEIEKDSSPLIKKLAPVKSADGMMKIMLSTADGTMLQHYRKQRNIVFDVYAAGTAPPPAPRAGVKTISKSGAPVVAKPSAPTPAPTPKPEVAKEAPAAMPKIDEVAKVVEGGEKPPVPKTPKPTLKETSGVLSDPSAIAAQKVPGTVAAGPAKEKLTVTKPALQTIKQPGEVKAESDTPAATITLSSLSSMKLAVFERGNALWVVTDASGLGAAMPGLSGGMSSFIVGPKVMKFKGGIAYRYVLPKKFYPRVTKEGLSWGIELMSEMPASTTNRPSSLRVETDKASMKTKMMVTLKGAGDTMAFEDPEIGDTLYVVPTSNPKQSFPETRRMPDLEILPSVAGFALRPLRDGIDVRQIEGLVLITTPVGLNVIPDGAAVLVEDEATDDESARRLFDFPNWRMGGIRKLFENKQVLQEAIVASETQEDRISNLMKLAMLYFANNFGQEALGVLSLVQAETPEMEKNPDFIAIRGAANAMAGHYKEALQDLSFAPIQQNPEVSLWKGFAAAATEQWRMADRSFPRSNRLLLQYPDNIAIPFTIYMAESALRLGHTDTARKLLDSINVGALENEQQWRAAVGYLRGEIFSQEGKPEEAVATWKPVANGLDRLYHTKASLAMNRMLLQQKKISLKDAIDQIDNLRFAWRGDGLEVEILHTLGALRVQNGQALQGMQDMQRSADLADSMLDDSSPIRDDMRRVFYDIFVADQASKMKPLEAISVYNEFSGLLPSGPEAQAAALNFSDYLIRVDLLERAASMIQGQIDAGAMPDDRMQALGTKLSAIYLLDSKPSLALKALQDTTKGAMSEKMQEERTLLKARAQSQLNQVAAAVSTLGTLNSKTAQRLKADVWWRASKWAEAAAAIEVLLPDNVTAISDEDAGLALNAAVAWKLAGNQEKLKEIKDKYEAAMAGKKLASSFGVVTRDQGLSSLADRDTMMKMAGEVDMFKGFLDSYKAKPDSGS